MLLEDIEVSATLVHPGDYKTPSKWSANLVVNNTVLDVKYQSGSGHREWRMPPWKNAEGRAHHTLQNVNWGGWHNRDIGNMIARRPRKPMDDFLQFLSGRIAKVKSDELKRAFTLATRPITPTSRDIIECVVSDATCVWYGVDEREFAREMCVCDQSGNITVVGRESYMECIRFAQWFRRVGINLDGFDMESLDGMSLKPIITEPIEGGVQ